MRQFAYPVYHEVKAYMSKKSNKKTDELENINNLITRNKVLKGKTKEEKQFIKTTIQKLKEKQKELKKFIKNDKEDMSQETALELCIKK
jgi:hypothetical protein